MIVRIFIFDVPEYFPTAVDCKYMWSPEASIFQYRNSQYRNYSSVTVPLRYWTTDTVNWQNISALFVDRTNASVFRLHVKYAFVSKGAATAVAGQKEIHTWRAGGV